MKGAARRAALVERLKASRILRDAAVEAALRSVPREIFVPHVTIESAYEDGPVAIKMRDGVAISSASQPTMIAIMLQQLRVAPGSRILEIGTGSGYNAALLAHLVTAAGRVTTIDIEPDLVDAARVRLRDFPNVFAAAADGNGGYAANAPYDRIIVTAAAWDVEISWWEQLREGGILVVPLALDSVQRCIAFERSGMTMLGFGAVECSFIALRGKSEASVDATHPTTQIARDPVQITAVRTGDLENARFPQDCTLVRRPASTFALSRGV